MLTAEEKWFFDLTGYMVLPQVIAPEVVQKMLALGDVWHDLAEDQLPPPLRSYHDPRTLPSTPRSIDNVIYGDPIFQELVLNPQIMRVVLTLTDNHPQLIAATYTRNFKDEDDIALHSGHDGGIRLPANDYQANGDKVFATFINAAVSLVDVPPGAGFVCVPGSHKSNFPCPEAVTIYDGPPIIHNVPVRAGDCVIFTEALRHGGRGWPLDEPRRTIFVRYSTSYASWSPGTGPQSEYREMLSDEVAELMQMQSHQQQKEVVRRLLNDLQTEAHWSFETSSQRTSVS